MSKLVTMFCFWDNGMGSSFPDPPFKYKDLETLKTLKHRKDGLNRNSGLEEWQHRELHGFSLYHSYHRLYARVGCNSQTANRHKQRVSKKKRKGKAKLYLSKQRSGKGKLSRRFIPVAAVGSSAYGSFTSWAGREDHLSPCFTEACQQQLQNLIYPKP